MLGLTQTRCWRGFRSGGCRCENHGVSTRLLESRKCWTGITAWQEARAGRRKDRCSLDTGIDQNADEAVLHLFPVLISPDNLFSRVRIVFVISGVVVMGDADDPRSFGEVQRLLHVISHLPVEVPFRLEEGLGFAGRIDDTHL